MKDVYDKYKQNKTLKNFIKLEDEIQKNQLLKFLEKNVVFDIQREKNLPSVQDKTKNTKLKHILNFSSDYPITFIKAYTKKYHEYLGIYYFKKSVKTIKNTERFLYWLENLEIKMTSNPLIETFFDHP
jgi:hypothetical protein